VRPERLGCFQAHQGIVAEDVPLPADRGDREAMAEEEAVAHRDVARGRHLHWRAVEMPRVELAAAVWQLDQHAAVAARRVGRHEQAEVAAEAHPTVGVARRFVQVDDYPVDLMLGIDRVRQCAVEPLIWSDIPEGYSTVVRFAAVNLERADTHALPLSTGAARRGVGSASAGG